MDTSTLFCSDIVWVDGFALSTWDISKDFKNGSTEKEMLRIANDPNADCKYFVLNTSLKDLYSCYTKSNLF
jgi:hypothetical protein